MNVYLKRAAHTVKLSFTLVGTIVGAGFLSGAELVRFFPSEGYLSYAIVSALLYAGCFYLLYRCGTKYGGFAGTVNELFGKGAQIIRSVLLISSLVMCASMFAGLNAAAEEGLGWKSAFPLAALTALPLLYFLSGKGVKGLFWINLALVPFILVFVISYAGISYEPGLSGDSLQAFSCLFSILVYVAMNCFLAAPLICDAGAEGKNGGSGCITAAALIGFCTAVLLSNIAAAGEAAQNAQMPFLYALGGEKIKVIFSLVCICGILTTLFSSWYPLHTAMQEKRRAKVWRAALLAAAFVLSLFGLKPIIRFVYPLVGAAGAIFLAVCAVRSRLLFDEPFFGKRDKRVHACGKYAQDRRCRHHEV